MKKQLFYCLLSCTSLCSITGHALEVSKTYVPTKKSMYHKEWIDFNKNGRKDIYEDPKAPLNERIEDLLSQMTVEEKTCQMVTLYGYQRVLKPVMERRYRSYR